MQFLSLQNNVWKKSLINYLNFKFCLEVIRIILIVICWECSGSVTIWIKLLNFQIWDCNNLSIQLLTSDICQRRCHLNNTSIVKYSDQAIIQLKLQVVSIRITISQIFIRQKFKRNHLNLNSHQLHITNIELSSPHQKRF